jgi:hypothetical protein
MLISFEIKKKIKKMQIKCCEFKTDEILLQNLSLI